MVRHVVLWRYQDGLTQEEKETRAAEIKRTLEALKGIIPGVIEIDVATRPLPSSNADVALVSLFESEEALAVYLAHPAHKEAGKLVRQVLTDRACVDSMV